MKAINPDHKPSDVAERNAVSAYMNNRGEADFDDIRAAVPLVAAHGDGELAQVCVDAGLKVDPL